MHEVGQPEFVPSRLSHCCIVADLCGDMGEKGMRSPLSHEHDTDKAPVVAMDVLGDKFQAGGSASYHPGVLSIAVCSDRGSGQGGLPQLVPSTPEGPALTEFAQSEDGCPAAYFSSSLCELSLCEVPVSLYTFEHKLEGHASHVLTASEAPLVHGPEDVVSHVLYASEAQTRSGDYSAVAFTTVRSPIDWKHFVVDVGCEPLFSGEMPSLFVNTHTYATSSVSAFRAGRHPPARVMPDGTVLDVLVPSASSANPADSPVLTSAQRTARCITGPPHVSSQWQAYPCDTWPNAVLAQSTPSPADGQDMLSSMLSSDSIPVLWLQPDGLVLCTHTYQMENNRLRLVQATARTL